MVEVLMSERRGKLMAFLKKLIPAAAVVLMVLAVGGSRVDAQTIRSSIRDGNRAYEKGKYNDAEVEYKKALEKDAKSHAGLFNLGDALYKQQRYDEAMREYNNAALATRNTDNRAASYYNLGNSFFRSNKLQESIEAYKQALRTNPGDEDARYNLQLALDRLKQQQQNKDQQKKQKDQQQQNQQQNQDQKQNQNQQQQQQPQNQSTKQDQTRAQQMKDQMPKEEADRILEALRNSEKQIQKELRKRPAAKVRVEKDW
jgi:tetratricopeptide (TPR) repeat protein